MNWKDDQIEKLILFYSHNSLFLVPDIWYQKSCNWYQILIPVFWNQFLVPVSGQYVMGIALTQCCWYHSWNSAVKHNRQLSLYEVHMIVCYCPKQLTFQPITQRLEQDTTQQKWCNTSFCSVSLIVCLHFLFTSCIIIWSAGGTLNFRSSC